MSVLRDPFTAKPYVLFYTTKRVGGGVQDFDAIKLLKMAASFLQSHNGMYYFGPQLTPWRPR